MSAVQAVGIDLGTTYSCLGYLNEQGEPVTLINREGESTTPSVVLFDRNGEVVVGTEALRTAIIQPDRVVQNAKRYIGDPKKFWTIDGRKYSPTEISALVLRKLLNDAADKIGPVTRAVITVPAQFSDRQRLATIKAGQLAGLKDIEIINEPVAAALCYVLGTEGLWFTELAEDQRILVYDLGGGTFDLSLVSYSQNEVRVIASSGDLHLGGIDWNQKLLDAIANQFTKEFGADPRSEPESLQHLSWEVEQCKRGLTARPKAALQVQHAGHRKTYQVEQAQFDRLTEPLVKRTEEITQRLLKDHKMGWAHVDVVLSTGGSSRMPMIRSTLKKMSGRTLNTALSPDLSIAHGATYYAGMLLTRSDFARSILGAQAQAKLSKITQRSVTARGLGILIRDAVTNRRVPYYLIAPNTPLPESKEHIFGTVIPNQKRVKLTIIESGASPEDEHLELGECEIDGLPPNLPPDSEIAVTISYDSSARVNLSAKDKVSGKQASVELVRTENLVTSEVPAAPVDDSQRSDDEVVLRPVESQDDDVEIVLTPVGPDLISRSAPNPAMPNAGRPDASVPVEGHAGMAPETPAFVPSNWGSEAAANAPAAKSPPTVTPKAQPQPPASSQPEPAPSRPASKPGTPSVKPIPMSPALQKPAAGIPPTPAATEKSPATAPPTRGASAGGAKPRSIDVAVPSLDDGEILELPLGKNPAGGKTGTARAGNSPSTSQPVVAPPASGSAKPRPKKPAAPKPGDEGADEFWRQTER